MRIWDKRIWTLAPITKILNESLTSHEGFKLWKVDLESLLSPTHRLARLKHAWKILNEK